MVDGEGGRQKVNGGWHRTYRQRAEYGGRKAEGGGRKTEGVRH